jgi:hypothetical protein
MKLFFSILLVLCFTATATRAQVNVTDTLSSGSEKKYYDELFAYADTLKVIDGHEHMVSAETHVKHYLSFWDFFSSYVVWDLYSAGMPKQYLSYHPKNEAETIALFNVIEPYLPYVKYGSYMRGVNVALKKFFGVDEINRSNYLQITRKLNENNTVEHYYQVFKDAHIVKLLNQCYEGKTTGPLYANITTIAWQANMENTITKMCRKNKNMTLKDVMAFYDKVIKKEKEAGSYGLKFFPHPFIEPYDTVIAKKQFESIKHGKAFNERSTLARYIYEGEIPIAVKYNLRIAIHLGVWADITDKSPSILFPIVSKYPNAIFDVYHMGIPWVRETAFLGKNYPNVNLNLCWAYSVSESMVLNSLDEWIDVVPTNKITAFGGDLITLPENVVGELEVAKQDLCTVLARRIVRQRMNVPDAKNILKAWFYDNPARIYGIKE